LKNSVKKYCCIAAAVFLLFATACKKTSTKPPVTPPVTDTVKQFGTPFASVPDTKDVAMYEVNISAFSSTKNLAGVTSRLDSIKALGINTVWLMPTYPVGRLKSFGSPYCVMNYLQVSPSFGTLGDLRTLVSTAHSKGMSVILDWVADHTSWDNPWIANKSWYKQDGSGNIIAPPGTTYTDVAALNYNSADMRKAMIKAMKYWVLEANIDGYRCDYADAIPTDFWSQAIDSLNHTGHKLVLLSEGSRAANLSSGFAINFGWNFYGAVVNVFGSGQANASGIGSANGQDISSIPSGTYMLHFTDNHDYDNTGAAPLAIYNGKSGSLAAFAITINMGGVPLVYSGQEVGVSANQVINQNTSINWSSNPDLLAAYKKLILFRNTSAAVKAGSVTLFNDPDVVVFERISGAETVLVIANTRNKVINYAVAPGLQSTNWNDALNTGNTVSLQTNLSLQPYAYYVLKN